jgi:acid phosphatase type 7
MIIIIIIIIGNSTSWTRQFPSVDCVPASMAPSLSIGKASTTTTIVALMMIAVVAVVDAHADQPPPPLALFRVDRLVDLTDSSSSVSVSVAPTTLTQSGEWVTVSWSGVDSPAWDDYLALYVPATANLSHTAPIKYKHAARSPTHLASGSGALRFHIVNMRAPVGVVFIRGGIAHPTVVARAPEPVTFVNWNEPLQRFVTLGPQPASLRLSWVTRDSVQPLARWGTASGVYGHSAPAVDSAIARAELCGPPATTVGWMEPGIIHTVDLLNLLPATRYYYQFGDAQLGNWSAEFSVYSPPAVASNTSFVMLAYGDMGQSDPDLSMQATEDEPAALVTSRRVANETVASVAPLVLHCGDISYARGYMSQWDEFFDMVGGYAAPVVTNIGNHERDYPGSGALYNVTDSGGECGVSYMKRLQMPVAGADQPWYGFDYGSVHVFMISTEHDFSAGSRQYADFVADMEAVDRSRTPWVIVSGHRPAYIDSTNDEAVTGDQPVAQALRAALEPLWVKYEVDLLLWGHHHSAQRTCPVVGEECVSPSKSGEYVAPVHLVIGHAGADFSTNIEVVRPRWTEFVNDHTHGYLRLTVSPAQLHLEMISNDDGSVMDSSTIAMPASRQRLVSQ